MVLFAGSTWYSIGITVIELRSISMSSRENDVNMISGSRNLRSISRLGLGLLCPRGRGAAPTNALALFALGKRAKIYRCCDSNIRLNNHSDL